MLCLYPAMELHVHKTVRFDVGPKFEVDESWEKSNVSHCDTPKFFCDRHIRNGIDTTYGECSVDAKIKAEESWEESIVSLCDTPKFYFNRHIRNGTGAYGKCIVGKFSGGNINLAVKVIKNENLLTTLVRDWPALKHRNILKLVHVKRVPSKDCHVFYTTYHPKSLETVLQYETYFKIAKSFHLVETWLIGILSGLRYLHDQGFCHLGIHLQNVVMTEEYTAVIGNFETLSLTTRAKSGR